MEPKDPEKQVFLANLMPDRGSWLEVEIDKKGKVFARIDRKRKLPVTTCCERWVTRRMKSWSRCSTARSTSATRSTRTPTSASGA
jgi:hypothetical protein